MNTPGKSIFSIAILVWTLGHLVAAFAEGGVVERKDLQEKFEGRVFVYQGDGSQRTAAPDFEFPGEAFSVPGRPLLKRTGAPRQGSLHSGMSFSSLPGAERMKRLGQALDEGGMAYEIVAHDHYCYVGTTNSLSVFDVTDPSAPVLMHEIKAPVGTLARYGTLLAGAMDFGGDFVLYDITDAAAPAEVSRIHAPDGFHFDFVSMSGSVAVATGYGLDDQFGIATILQVIDIGNPGAPVIESTMLGLGDYFRNTLLEQNLMYLAVQYEGLAVFDLTDPGFIKQVGFIANAPITDGMVHEGGLLYCSGDKGLEIVDVADPGSPVLIGQLGPGYTAEIRVSGDYAYLADDDDRTFRVVDISDPANPVLVINYPAFGRTYTLDLLGDMIFVADMVYGLLAVDISVPASPALLSMTATGAFPRAIDVEGSRAVVTANTALLYTLDVSDPFAPGVQVIHMPVPDTTANNTLWTLAVDLDGDIASAGHWNWGIHVYDVSDPALPEKPGALKISGIDVTAVAVKGDVVYTGSTELLAVDISDPANPVPSSTGITVPDDIWTVKISGDTAYMTGRNEVVILDITSPLAPVELHRFTVHDYIKGIAVENNLMGVFWEWYDYQYFGGFYKAQFELFDVTDPMNPAPLGTLEIPEFLEFTRPGGSTLAVENGRFFIASYERLVAVDATDPLNPFIAATYPETTLNSPSWCGSEGLCAANGLVYLCSHAGVEVLRFLDVGIFLEPEDEPLQVKQGESFSFELRVENFTTGPKTVQARIDPVFPGPSDGPVAEPLWVTLEPGENVIHTRNLAIPQNAAPGTYHLDAHVLEFPGVEMDRDRITFEVITAD